MRHHHDNGAAAPGQPLRELIPGSATPADGPALQRKPSAGDSGRYADERDVAQFDAEREAFVTLRARGARLRIGMYRIAEGYPICWGSTFRELPDLAEVEALLQRPETI